MNYSKFLGRIKPYLLIIVALVLAIGLGAGYLILNRHPLETKQEENKFAEPVKVTLANEKRLIKIEDLDKISVPEVEKNPKIPAYDLPLDLSQISNFSKFTKALPLSNQTLELIKQNGFAIMPTTFGGASKELFVSPGSGSTHFGDAFYNYLDGENIPVFVTADTLLHFYHLFFDTTLIKLEQNIFFDNLWQISKQFYDQSLKDYEFQSQPELKEAAKRNAAYFAVALSLLSPKTNMGQLPLSEILKDGYCEWVYQEKLTEGLLKKVAKKEAQKVAEKEARAAYEKNHSFGAFSVAEAKKYQFSVPDFIAKEVNSELSLIEAHKGWEYSPLFTYKEDYSQYVPRGHYTKSERLKNYFKAMMWYGRMTLLAQGSKQLTGKESGCLSDGIISEEEAKIQTLQAALIAKYFSQNTEIQKYWNKIYAITAFFVGYSDDLGPYEYMKALNSVLGNKNNIDINDFPAIQQSILALPRNPKIYSGLGKCELPMVGEPPLSQEQLKTLVEQARAFLEKTKGFRLMGQRFVPDSYIFSEIVSPYSGEYTGDKQNKPFTYVLTQTRREVRGFPRGLDLMALLGSERAKALIKELGDANYNQYQPVFDKLQSEVNSYKNEDWYQNLYWAWLYSLKPLLEKFGLGYPTFMQTEAYQDKSLTTALASWTELRHDTILYVKQSYTMAELGGEEEPKIVGYVEPIPELYSRLIILSAMTKNGLESLLSPEDLKIIDIENISQFIEILNKLLQISNKELRYEPLTDEEYLFIKYFGENTVGLIRRLVANPEGGDIIEGVEDILKSTLVTDVHTEGNTEKVLEEGVGYIKTMIVVYRVPPKGYLLMAAGPVLSYYEFKQPMDNRLTDEAWREKLKTNAPAEPEWVKNFSSEK